MQRLDILLLLTAGWLAGCDESQINYVTQDRLEKGLVIVLPGIEGESQMNHDIRDGLASANVPTALPIYLWGRPVPLAGPLLNQMDVFGNRLEAIKIANMIVQYQDSHPNLPVYLVGHSGGGGMAVFAAEALPPGRQVNGLVLLSASLSSGYDLTKALDKTKNGLVNFYSNADIGFLVVGTSLAGNVDGARGPAAGAIGFDNIREKDPPAKKQAYAKLFQVQITDVMTGGDLDAHAASTRVGFVSGYVAPWVLSPAWPAGTATSVMKKVPAAKDVKALAYHGVR